LILGTFPAEKAAGERKLDKGQLDLYVKVKEAP
jgi:hypothetical protein